LQKIVSLQKLAHNYEFQKYIGRNHYRGDTR
jgi:hypothetical protein